jgi:hypothetical protein
MRLGIVSLGAWRVVLAVERRGSLSPCPAGRYGRATHGNYGGPCQANLALQSEAAHLAAVQGISGQIAGGRRSCRSTNGRRTKCRPYRPHLAHP